MTCMSKVAHHDIFGALSTNNTNLESTLGFHTILGGYETVLLHSPGPSENELVLLMFHFCNYMTFLYIKYIAPHDWTVFFKITM